MSLVACGGDSFEGDGDDGGDGGSVLLLVMAISNENISADSPATVSATLTEDGVAIEGQLVTFVLNNSELASFSPEVGTAITDSSGVATVILNVGPTSGSGTVTGSVQTTSEPLTASISFTSEGDGISGEVSTIADIGLYANSQQLASSGSQAITLTAIAKDENNNLLEDVTVTFTASSGQIEVITAITGTDGKASAILKTDNEPTNRIITTSVTSGQVTDSVDIQVIGTAVTLTGSTSLAINDSNSYIIKVLNSDSVGIANTLVNLSLTGESTTNPAGDVAEITIPTSVMTDFTGQATVSVVGTSGGTNSIVATTLGASVSRSVAVQADSFLFTDFDNGDASNVNPSEQPTPIIPDVLLSDTASVTLSWARSGTAIPDGTLVEFTTTRGELVLSSATTVDGEVTAQITSTDAGKALVTFTGTDSEIVLNNQLEFEFVAETVETIKAQASPKSIGPNGQTSTISIVVKDINGNLVKNKVIDFTLTDTNGGSIFPATGLTDSNGSASTVYTSNGISAQNGVQVKSTVREDSTKTDTVNLTVADRELFIAIGTGNELIELDLTTYNKQYTVFVTDADSTPVENVTLTVSAIPRDFYKGAWYQGYDISGSFVSWYAGGQTALAQKFECDNEDLNLDGILDVGEDVNGNGMLTPGNVVAATGEVTTDSQGRAVIDILYPQSFAQWVDITLILSTRVNGTESSTQTTFTLPVLASDVLNEDVSPPTAAIGTSSPFGLNANCSNVD